MLLTFFGRVPSDRSPSKTIQDLTSTRPISPPAFFQVISPGCHSDGVLWRMRLRRLRRLLRVCTGFSPDPTYSTSLSIPTALSSFSISTQSVLTCSSSLCAKPSAGLLLSPRTSTPACTSLDSTAFELTFSVAGLRQNSFVVSSTSRNFR